MQVKSASLHSQESSRGCQLQSVEKEADKKDLGSIWVSESVKSISLNTNESLLLKNPWKNLYVPLNKKGHYFRNKLPYWKNYL
jgi:hypothetical protein